MDIKILLGLAAVLFEIVSGFLYYRSIFQGKTRPHIYTFLVWGIVTSIAFGGQIVSGGAAGSWATGASALLILSLIPLSWRYGTNDVTRTDAVFLAAAIFSIIPWLLTKSPLWSVVLATLIDALAMFPTIRKTWSAPRSESLSSWVIAEAKIVSGILALGTYTVTTWLYPVQALTLNAVLIAVILYRRHQSI